MRARLTLIAVIFLSAGCGAFRNPYGEWIAPRDVMRPRAIAVVPAADDNVPGLGPDAPFGVLAASAVMGVRRVLGSRSADIPADFSSPIITLRTPKTKTELQSLPDQWQGPLKSSAADGLLVIWARVNMGLLNKGSVSYWVVLYSKSGWPLWKDQFDVRNEPLMASYGTLRSDFSWNSTVGASYKKDAETSGIDIAEKLRWWLDK